MKSAIKEGSILPFLRQRDYVLIKELGQGACGKTVLMRDPLIDHLYVCKKYVPYSELERPELYKNFVREVKLLHLVHHENIVRVFNFHLYPEIYAGSIVMEYIEGREIDAHIKAVPEQASELFRQAISAFAYLESREILHRDIRPGNIMVSTDGRVKVIDFGFGKKIVTSLDYDKSISLNWEYDTPDEFRDSVYNFKTEVYFVGKLFEKMIVNNGIAHFTALFNLVWRRIRVA